MMNKQQRIKKSNQVIKKISKFCKHHKVASITKNKKIYMISHETIPAGFQIFVGSPTTTNFDNGVGSWRSWTK